MDKSTEMLPGLLEMLILKAVSLGPLHGYGRLESLRQGDRRGDEHNPRGGVRCWPDCAHY